ncbi:MAG: CotH kinase family protein [Bacteroidota bacterium]
MRNLILFCIAFFFVLTMHAQDFYDLEHIPEIRVTFEESNWEELLDKMKAKGDKKRLTATVSIDGEVFKQVGVRYKGNSSYNNPKSKGYKKLPFNMKASYKNKKQLFPGGYKTIKLSNVFRDASYTREVLSYEIARKYMPAPRCNFAKLYVNDEYIGLYNNTQAVDKVLLEESFDSSKNAFFKCDPEYSLLRKLEERRCPQGDKASLMYLGDDKNCYEGWYEMESKEESDWNELIQFIKNLNTSSMEYDKIMNVDMVLWMHAFNNVLVNLDSYTGRLSHNYYLYKTPDQLFTPLVWDMNISFGGFQYDGIKKGPLTHTELQKYSMFAHYKTKNQKRPLIVNLLSDPLYRKIYVGHCKTILEENFSNGYYMDLAKKVQGIIDQEVLNDPNKLYSYEDFKKNLHESVSIGYSQIIGVEELMKARTDYLSKHPLFNGTNPSIEDSNISVSEGTVFFMTTSKDAENVYVCYRNAADKPWQRVAMDNDGTGTWRGSATGSEGLEYYFIAEGNRLAICDPANASYKPYVVE